MYRFGLFDLNIISYEVDFLDEIVIFFWSLMKEFSLIR